MALSGNLTDRVARRIRGSVTRARYRLGLQTLPAGHARLSETFSHPIDAARKPEIIGRYHATFPESAEAELIEAQQLLDHHFHLLGHTAHHEREIAWSRDPVSGKDWSRTFSPDIPYRGPGRLGDIKLPWELNKHQYFFTLGKAAWLSGDHRFAREILTQTEDWIATNPCYQGIHWISALETGTRALSWILAYPFFKDLCDAGTRERMAHSIAQHLSFVERHLSTGRYANTHLAGEAAILVVGGLFLDCKQSRRWISTGLRHLEEQINAQVHKDGFHAEQSVAYHRFFLDQYYLVHAFLSANGRSLSPQAYRRMEQMTGALMDLLFPDGSAPAFGDCDDARGLWCHATCPQEYRSLLALGAVLSGRGDFKYVARTPTEEVLWLFGPEGLDRFGCIPAIEPKHASMAYADAGYYIMRGGWDHNDPMLVFDSGPLGRGSAGHAHADALSFQLYQGGYAFLVDTGTYTYNLSYDWRDRFRSTKAHNSIAVDDLDQSVPQDRMSWSQAAVSTCRRWTTTPTFDLVDSEHSGYLRLADPVLHRRIAVFIRPDVWFVYDLLLATGEHQFEMNLHVQPDCSLHPMGPDGLTELRSPHGQHLFVHGAFEQLSATSQSWFSAGYGQKMPADGLVQRRRFKGTTSLLTGLSSRATTGFEVRAGTDALHIYPEAGGGQTSTFFYRLSADGTFQDATRSFRGELLFHNEPTAAAASLLAENFTVLELKGVLTIRSPAAIERLQIANGEASITIAEPAAAGLILQASTDLEVRVNGEPLRSGGAMEA